MNVVALNADVMAGEAVSEEDALLEAQAKKAEILASLGSGLEADKNKAVRWRLPIEQRMIDDLRQKHGEQPSLGEVKGANAVSAGRNNTADADFRVTRDNITRPATIQIAARLADMLFPTNEKNWDLTPSPLPELANPDEAINDPTTGQPLMTEGPAGPDGQPGPAVPMTAAMLATKVQKLADQKCTRMKQKIDDCLQESKYARHGRRAIQDACDIGTGIIKKATRQTRHTSFTSYTMPDGSKIPDIKVIQKKQPGLYWADPWNIFPQPCREISEAEHIFELHLLTKKKVRALAKQPGFDPEQINQLLSVDPDIGELGSGGSLVERDKILSPTLETMADRYSVWEYHGPIPREALTAMGMELSEDDKLTVYAGEVWFSQGIVLKVSLSTDEYSDCLPYYFFPYEPDPTCCFGFSVPYVMRSDQYAVNQTWHAVMLNAMMSAGSQVGVIPGQMEPINGKRDMTCFKPKVWAMKDGVADIRQVLSFWNMPNFTGPLMQVYETARRNASEKTLLPAWADGEANKATQTSSGLAMLMNSANIVQRQAAKLWDDCITIPAIGDLNRDLLLDPSVDNDAKGDYNVMPKGESYLLVKDVQAQHVQVLTQIAENPRYAPYFDTWELLQLNVKTLSLPVEGLLRERQTVEEEMKQAQGQPDPETLKAQAAQAQAEAATIRAQAEAARTEAAERQHEREMQDRNAERIARLTIAEAQLGMEANKLLSREATEGEKTAARERTESLWQEVEQTRLGMQAALKAEEIASKEQKIATEIAVESPGVRLA